MAVFKKHNPGCPCCEITGSETGSNPFGDCTCCEGELPSGFQVRITSSTQRLVFFDCDEVESIDETQAATSYPRSGDACDRWAAAVSALICCPRIDDTTYYRQFALDILIECIGGNTPGIRVSYLWSMSDTVAGLCLGDRQIVQDESEALCTADLTFSAPFDAPNGLNCPRDPDCGGSPSEFVDDWEVTITPL